MSESKRNDERITINKGDENGKIFDEGVNRYHNILEAVIHIPDQRKKVTIDAAQLLNSK